MVEHYLSLLSDYYFKVHGKRLRNGSGQEILVSTKKSEVDIVTESNFLGGAANKPVLLVYVDTSSGFSSSLMCHPFLHLTEKELLLNFWLFPQRFPRNCQVHFKCVARVWMRKKEIHMRLYNWGNLQARHRIDPTQII